MSRPTHTDAGLKIEAYRCTWDGGGESAGWVQYHDPEGGDDPMPDAWDDEPDEVVTLVLAADAGAKIQKLAKIGAENFSAAVEARDAADAAAQQAAELHAECEQLRRWKSTHAPRIEALEGLLVTAQREAAAGAEALAWLESERAANAILTDECERLRLNAERYVWLRDKATGADWEEMGWHTTGESTDAAIDAARTAQQDAPQR